MSVRELSHKIIPCHTCCNYLLFKTELPILFASKTCEDKAISVLEIIGEGKSQWYALSGFFADLI